MADAPPGEDAGHSWRWLATLLLALPLLYVLSIGPVAAITSKSNHNVSWVKKYYAPVLWLHDHTPLKGPLESYVKLWGVK